MREIIGEFIERHAALSGVAICAIPVGIAIWLLPPLPYRQILIAIGAAVGAGASSIAPIVAGEWLRDQHSTSLRWAGNILLWVGYAIGLALVLGSISMVIWAKFGAGPTECSHWC